MPRPLSETRQPPSASNVTSILVASPAIASSTELSTTSYTRWCRPDGPVEPMYMPGRSRTGSRPLSTVMSLAVYATRGAFLVGVRGGVRFTPTRGRNPAKVLVRTPKPLSSLYQTTPAGPAFPGAIFALFSARVARSVPRSARAARARHRGPEARPPAPRARLRDSAAACRAVRCRPSRAARRRAGRSGGSGVPARARPGSPIRRRGPRARRARASRDRRSPRLGSHAAAGARPVDAPAGAWSRRLLDAAVPHADSAIGMDGVRDRRRGRDQRLALRELGDECLGSRRIELAEDVIEEEYRLGTGNLRAH